MTALKLWVLHLESLNLIPLAVRGPMLELHLVSLSRAPLVWLYFDDRVVVHFAQFALLLCHCLQDGCVLLRKSVEFDLVAPIHFWVPLLLALLLLRDLHYFLS